MFFSHFIIKTYFIFWTNLEYVGWNTRITIPVSYQRTKFCCAQQHTVNSKSIEDWVNINLIVFWHWHIYHKQILTRLCSFFEQLYNIIYNNSGLGGPGPVNINIAPLWFNKVAARRACPPLTKCSHILTAESNGAKVGGWFKWDCSIINIYIEICIHNTCFEYDLHKYVCLN